MPVKKQQLEQNMEQQTGSKSGKECVKAVYCHPAYLIYMWTQLKRLSSSSSNSAYKLNKQGDNIQPWHAPFPIWNQSVVPCLVDRKSVV